ncbi:hypothetical protein N7479_010191 [Penicillium vulpinum]|nr:hypothetical protein N7479_010191 [Penicillium vulpinum]
MRGDEYNVLCGAVSRLILTGI